MITYEYTDPVAELTIDRPDRANALSHEDCLDLADGLARAEEDARVAVIRAATDATVFCAGDDIQHLDELETAADLRAHFELISGVLHGIEETEIPVIAAVDGDALGGGCELVVACDLAVASEGARFSLPETRLGTFPSFAVERVAVTGGRKRVMELVLTGEPISADEASDCGLVNRVVPAEDVDDAVETYVDAIVESPKGAVTIAKEHANTRIRDAGEYNRMLGGNALLFSSTETREGVRAFVEGREPSWRE
ncbi:MAG: enoyl-CoA hydratase/isomerase family protein [Haloplanus sp.]